MESPSRWRHLRAIGPLPGMVAVVVPALLALAYGTNVGWGLASPAGALPVLAGVLPIAAGLRLIWETISLFGSVGKGTLAPWDPTTRLVVEGPYRRVRNPMISGVGAVLMGEAALLGSVPILIEFAVFATVNAIYIPLFEEPGLERRFGEEYREYKRRVPRWIPRSGAKLSAASGD